MDMSKSAKLVENIKSVMLVVLLLFTILLLYFFWGSSPFKTLTEGDRPQAQAVSAIDMIQPDHIDVCLGGDAYTVTENKFGVIMDCFKEFSASKTLSIEEISKSGYDEVMKLPSIRAVFDYYVPFSAICDIYGIDKIPGADAVSAVSELGYAAGYDDSLFISDKRSGKYFRIAGSAGGAFTVLKDEIEAAKNGGFTYFTVGTYVGGEVKNNALCPVSFESDAHDIPYSPEDFSAHQEKLNEIIKGFFSGNFDFVRRIEEEGGTVIYMYGYGKTVVIARSDGTLEFKGEDDEKAATQLKYLEAFDKAGAFIAAHGAFDTLDGAKCAPYLKEVVTDPDGKKGFRFIFGMKINGRNVYYQDGAPVIVDVTNGKVTYFKRSLIDVGQATAVKSGSREVYSAINLLAVNNEYIRNALAEAGVTDAAGITFDEIAAMTSRFDSGYVRADKDKGELKAAWIVMIGGLEFYFGLDDGTPIGYYGQ